MASSTGFILKHGSIFYFLNHDCHAIRNYTAYALIRCLYPERYRYKVILLCHRRNSIQGTDYIANYFFLNLTVSRAKIENLK